MAKSFIVLFFTLMLLVTCGSLTSYHSKSNSESISFPLAFAQVPSTVDPGDPGNTGGTGDPGDAGDPGDPGSGTNATDIPPPDTSSDLGNLDQNGTLGSSTNTQTANPGANSTSSATQTTTANQSVPEFGPLPALVLGASIMVALIIGQRTFFKFKP